MSAGTAADGATIKEGSFFIGKGGRLSQIVNGRPVAVAIRQGKSGEGITIRAAKVIRALLADPRRHPRRAACPGCRPPLG